MTRAEYKRRVRDIRRVTDDSMALYDKSYDTLRKCVDSDGQLLNTMFRLYRHYRSRAMELWNEQREMHRQLRTEIGMR